ncbi:Ca2+-binding protein, RTX toxin-related, partial [Lutimaribacter pacificus]
SYTYTPDPDFNGTDEFTYTVSDGNGGTDTATVTLTVGAVNDAPDAVDDSETTPFDTPVEVDVLGNDTDPENDPLTVVGTTDGANGTVAIDPVSGNPVYTPDPGFAGTDAFTYTISDGNGGTDTATVTVTVEANPRDGIVEGTAGDDFIGTESPLNPGYTYEGDPEGDLVDSGDAILPGEAPEDDIIYAYDGNDTVDAGLGDDDVYGGTGDDELLGGEGDDSLFGEEGDDTLRGGTGDDHIEGGDGNDSVRGNEGNDTILGGAGSDTLRGGEEDDLIHGGDDDDSVIGGEGDDTLHGDGGNDTIRGVDGNDLIFGGDGDDSILGEDGRDTVHGEAGDDFIDTSSRPGFSNPLPDIDYPGYYPADPDTEDDRDLVHGGDGDDTILTGDDADTIYGGAGNDSIDGGIDADLIHGEDGDDTIIGSEGADTILGGAGDDLIYGGLPPGYPDFVNVPDETDLRPGNNIDVIRGGDGNDTIFGADDADILYGDEGDDYIDGGVDDDRIFGGTGDDTLLGGHGDDLIQGEAGNDVIDGGIGDDTLLGGAGDDAVGGGDGDDVIEGGTGDDLLRGEDGDDSIIGGAGDDTIIGGDGADNLAGGDDRDLFTGVGIGDVIDGDAGGDDYDVLDLTGSAPAGGSLNVTITGPDSNGNGVNGFVSYFDATGAEAGRLDFTEIEEIVPCFTPGTTIATPQGERLVEDLAVGDRVITRDNGIQEIRWIGAKPVTGLELARDTHLKPILIRKGALGNDLPERDMLVSPNHRLLVNNDKTALYFEEREVLAAAKHLVGAEGIHEVDVMSTTYIHFMFDHHEVVLSNGSWTESFQPGDMSLKGVGNAQRNEIFELFPELRTRDGIDDYQAARRSLKKHEARLLIK